MSAPAASATVEVAAPAGTVYDWITDLDTLAGFGEEVHAMRWVSGEEVAPGAVFAGANRNGVRRWTTRCAVTDAEPGRRFGFRVTYLGVPIARWEYVVDAAGTDRCRVTESWWDDRPALVRPLGGLATGVGDRVRVNQGHIETTLGRIRAYAER